MRFLCRQTLTGNISDQLDLSQLGLREWICTCIKHEKGSVALPSLWQSFLHHKTRDGSSQAGPTSLSGYCELSVHRVLSNIDGTLSYTEFCSEAYELPFMLQGVLDLHTRTCVESLASLNCRAIELDWTYPFPLWTLRWAAHLLSQLAGQL